MACTQNIGLAVAAVCLGLAAEDISAVAGVSTEGIEIPTAEDNRDVRLFGADPIELAADKLAERLENGEVLSAREIRFLEDVKADPELSLPDLSAPNIARQPPSIANEINRVQRDFIQRQEEARAKGESLNQTEADKIFNEVVDELLDPEREADRRERVAANRLERESNRFDREIAKAEGRRDKAEAKLAEAEKAREEAKKLREKAADSDRAETDPDGVTDIDRAEIKEARAERLEREAKEDSEVADFFEERADRRLDEKEAEVEELREQARKLRSGELKVEDLRDKDFILAAGFEAVKASCLTKKFPDPPLNKEALLNRFQTQFSLLPKDVARQRFDEAFANEPEASFDDLQGLTFGSPAPERTPGQQFTPSPAVQNARQLEGAQLPPARSTRS